MRRVVGVAVAAAVEVDEEDRADEDRRAGEQAAAQLPPRGPRPVGEGDLAAGGLGVEVAALVGHGVNLVDGVPRAAHGGQLGRSRTAIERSRCTSSSRARVVAFCGKTVSNDALTAAPISTAIATR